MSRGRSKKPQSEPNRPWSGKSVFLFVLVFATLALLLGVYYRLPREGPPVPDPDRSAMEPQVAAKIQEARSAVLDANRSHEAWGRLGMVLQAHKLENDAAVCYQRAAELQPQEFRWHYLLAHGLRDTDPQGALAQAETASKLRPDYSPVYVLRGQLLEQANQADAAMEQYQKAAGLDPASALAEFALGRLYLAKGELQEALHHLLRARDLSEEAGTIHGFLAQVYGRLGDRETASRENRLASELTASIAITDPVHYAMQQESVSSITQLERAIQADRAGDFERAEALYRELIRLRPDDAEIHARFGDTLARQSKLQPAKEQYQAALAVNPRHASAHYGLGNMLNYERDYDRAARHYRAALETRPEHVSTLVNLGSITAFQGKLDEAASLFRKALEVDPKAFGPNRQLGQLLVQGKKFREAIPYLRAAIEVKPDSAPVHLSLGMALATTGDYRSAWTEVTKAQELGESVPPELVVELKRRVADPTR